MIDLVYILGGGSVHQHKELDYSIRSVQKFLTGYRNIYVVGDKPLIEGPYIHIDVRDHNRNKQDNIRRKLLAACKINVLTQEFAMMNDDYFFHTPLDIATIPNYYSGDLLQAWRRKRKPGHYKNALNNTVMTLTEKKLPLLHFDVHCPIRYDKHLFPQIIDDYDWPGERDGFVIKSLYGNSLQLESVETKDVCINIPCTDHGQIEAMIGDHFMFSIGEQGTNEVMLSYLEKLFPRPVVSQFSETIEKQ